MPPRVSSENTTPKPNVSSAALRSQTVISLCGASCLVSAAKYSPPGPPPTTAIRIAPPRSVPGRLPDIPGSASRYAASATTVNTAPHPVTPQPHATAPRRGDTPAAGLLPPVRVYPDRWGQCDPCAPMRAPPKRGLTANAPDLQHQATPPP